MANNGQKRNREGGYSGQIRGEASSGNRRRNTVSSRNMEHGEVFPSGNAGRSGVSSKNGNRGGASSHRSEGRNAGPSQRGKSRGAGSSQKNAGRNADPSLRSGNRGADSSRRNGGHDMNSSRRSAGRSSALARDEGRGQTSAANRGRASSGRRRPRNKYARLLRGGPLRIVLLILAAVVILFLAVLVFKSFLCRGSVTIEAGESFGVSNFLKQDNPEAAFTDDSDSVDTNVPGDYTLKIKNGIFTHKCTLHVKDTIAPQGTANDMSTVLGRELEASAFVTDIVDVTPVTVSYAVKPDFTQEGDQNVELVLEDSSKNKTTLTATLTLMRDTEAPVITGVRDITHSIGSGISYKANVNVTDNLDPDVELEVNTDGVDLNTEGTYQVTYSATDFSGNSTSQTATVTVIRSTYDEETIMGIANDILAEITTDDMSDYDKASAIYDWVRSHITYTGSSSEAWTDAAYEGMVQGRGDCWAYTSASRALLTAAGINNMVIRKIPSDTTHAWNLVDLGEGWYHFDATPRASHNERFFMWTDAQLMEYSNAYGLTHNYDKTQYPNIN